MNRTVKLVITTAMAFFLSSMALNFFLLIYGINQAQAAPLRSRIFGEFVLLREAFAAVRENFVDEDKVAVKELMYGAIEGIIRALDDPYSRLMRPKKFKDMKTSTKGSFGGLGIIIGERDNRITIISPIKGSPAFKEGVHAGDVIVKVDGKSIKGKSLHDVVEKLRGVIDTKVTITVFREGERQLLDFTITRAEIQLPSVKYYLSSDGIGYISISSFIQTTGDTIDALVGQMEEKGLKALILDVRGNPGGLLQAAVKVARVFLGRKKIVTVKSRKGDSITYSSFRENHRRVPLTVLIDKGSASASEILAGAIKDNKRGILLGEKSFGKGSVQTVLPLSDGSAMAITTAHYYTPSGVCIHKKGIEPNVPVKQQKLTREQVREFRSALQEAYNESMKEGAIESGSAQGLPEQEFETMLRFDTQLQRAADILRTAEIFAHTLGKKR